MSVLIPFPYVKAGAEPNYSAWIARVEEVKARYPLPESSKAPAECSGRGQSATETLAVRADSRGFSSKGTRRLIPRQPHSRLTCSLSRRLAVLCKRGQ
ncbi:hypothetical protein FA331_09515 [Pseudomonas aeruginosa]|nr:hypothetical protein [Pseudomonas aeruginosa]MCO2544466.1 hypothetical protein [Pseudomonas aeruginosa]PNN35728.1 hypothetical protein AL512_014575 [Pseudomonas aeruginosa]PQM09362.1 hypothetical protein C5F85_26745 [Pseudomonas aeruginosa]PTY98975.1 hypothetical protein DB384_27005 [Pseudomonas aeruginosa]